MLPAYEYMRVGNVYLFKDQAVFLQQFQQHIFVVLAEIQYPKLAFPVRHILDDLSCLGFSQDKAVLIGVIFLYDVDESVYCKGIVLARDCEFRLSGSVFDKALFHDLRLLQQHTRIRKELFPVPCGNDPFVRSHKNSHAHLFFQIFYRGAQARLRYEQLLCGLGHVPAFRCCHQISQLLQCHPLIISCLFSSVFFPCARHCKRVSANDLWIRCVARPDYKAKKCFRDFRRCGRMLAGHHNGRAS